MLFKSHPTAQYSVQISFTTLTFDIQEIVFLFADDNSESESDSDDRFKGESSEHCTE